MICIAEHLVICPRLVLQSLQAVTKKRRLVIDGQKDRYSGRLNHLSALLSAARTTIAASSRISDNHSIWHIPILKPTTLGILFLLYNYPPTMSNKQSISPTMQQGPATEVAGQITLTLQPITALPKECKCS